MNDYVFGTYKADDRELSVPNAITWSGAVWPCGRDTQQWPIVVTIPDYAISAMSGLRLGV